MNSNKKTIAFTGILSFIAAMLTYVVCLNMDIKFFMPNWPWLSNNFVLTLCGGVFASLLVVMLCELQKYIENKANCEQYIFYKLLYLYLVLFKIQKNIEDYLSMPEKAIPENLLDSNIYMAQSQINALQCIDYSPFFPKKNQMLNKYRALCEKVLQGIDSFLICNNYFRQSILETKIKNLELYGQEKEITSSDLLVKQTLTKIKGKTASYNADLSFYLEEIDKACKNRFRWDTKRIALEESYISIFEFGKLEDFLKR